MTVQLSRSKVRTKELRCGVCSLRRNGADEGKRAKRERVQAHIQCGVTAISVAGQRQGGVGRGAWGEGRSGRRA
jgi:hypothetical protein